MVLPGSGDGGELDDLFPRLPLKKKDWRVVRDWSKGLGRRASLSLFCPGTVDGRDRSVGPLSTLLLFCS